MQVLRRWPVLTWALWLVGLPATLAVVVMSILADRPVVSSVQRLETVQRWVEPLPAGTPWTLEGFTTLMTQKPDFASGDWQPTTLPSFIELPPQFSAKPDEPMARAWFRFTYVVPADHPPEEPLALYVTRIMAGALSLWVNGQLVTAKLDDWRMQWSYPVLLAVPLQMTTSGQVLEVELAVPYRLSQGYAVGSLYIGRTSELEVSSGVRLFLQRTLPIMGMVLVGIFGLLSLTMWLRRRAESEHLWLSLLAGSVVVCNLQYTHEFSANEEASRWFGFIVDASVSWVFLLYAILCFRISHARFPKSEFALVAFTVGNAVLTLPVWGWDVNGMVLQHYLTAAVYMQTLAMLTWLALKRRTFDSVAFATGVWLLLLAGIWDLTFMANHLKPDFLWLFSYGAFVVVAVSEIVLQRRYAGAMSSLESANQRMEVKLAEHESELMAQQSVLLRAERDRTSATERARLVNEIHANVGQRLTGAAAALGEGTTDVTGASNEIQACIDDLKLMIDSLDPEAHQLEALLGGLRYRFADRLKAAGIQLDWQVEALPHLQWLDAPQALELLRVIHALVGHAIAEDGARHLRLAANDLGSKVTILVEHDTVMSGRATDNTTTARPFNFSVQERVQQRLKGPRSSNPDHLSASLEACGNAETKTRQYLISLPL